MDKHDCGVILEMLPDYLNKNNLSREVRAEVVNHLALCQSCRAEAAFLIKLKGMAKVLQPEIPEEITETAFKKLKEIPGGCEQEKELSLSMALGIIKDTFFITKKVVNFAYQNL
ncbi:MAG: zf-HC2 domain-containing protein [Clostridiales bacterium]|jgi:hypothetical protein|nr:zf-HC2 domain-containing protein [Clostridiales bacterium]